MPYITGQREQNQLFPACCIEEYIDAADPVRAYDAFVDALDFAQLGIEDDPYRVGHPQFDPRAMVKLLVYGYSYGIRSSRKLERATYHNVSFIWLIGGLKPDHKTIARFRRDQAGALKNVLKQCARVCLRLGLVEGNTLFVDGTKVRANASMKHTWTAERCQKSLGEIDRRIEAILKECERVDQSEETHGSSVKMQQALQDQRDLKAQIDGALAELQEQDKTALNTTDPECARVRNGGQIETGYNCQAVVDDRHGLIVHSDVLNQSNDVGLFSEQIAAAQDTLEKVCQRAVADTGYSSPEDLKKSLDQNIDVVVPINRCSDFRDHFSYDADQDIYRCPEGHVLRYAGINNRNKSHMYSMTDAAICLQCPRFGSCTRSRAGRRVERPFTEEIRERLEARYRLPDAPLLMRRRKMRAEHPFGHIKHNLGMRAFLMRGLGGVRTEMALAATAFNVTRMIKLMGIVALIQKLDPSLA
jgi:transposase